MVAAMMRYSVACRGRSEGEGKHRVAICKGWGRYGDPKEKCPKCGGSVVVTGVLDATPLGVDGGEHA